MKGGGGSPFSRTGVLALLIVGFGVFGTILYLIGVGDFGPQESNNGQAHAAAKGLTGYSALAALLEADGADVKLSRESAGLKTTDLLVLTPPRNMDPEDLREIIEERDAFGPTLIILPKWSAVDPRFMSAQIEDADAVERGWVVLSGASSPRWASEESGPLALDVVAIGRTKDAAPADMVAALDIEPTNQTDFALKSNQPRPFKTRAPLAPMTGNLPSAMGFHSRTEQPHTPLVVDAQGRTLALSLDADAGSEDPDMQPSDLGWVVFVIEPDLMNNWGLADPARAQAALAIVRFMDEGFGDRVVFDLTTNGFGATLNLLTFAFRPPFLAATICLCLAMLVLGWRAFFRFGPAVARKRQTAFGKAQLVTNGADLIVRGNRLALLTKPYAALAARRMAGNLGLTTHDPQTIDASLQARQAGAPSFVENTAELTTATNSDAVLSAAQALYEQSARPETDSKGHTQE
ncbi:MAG: DUF4350 domain-containing protein [Pseudomonadota bacterium]